MAKLAEISIAELQKIKGIGTKKIEKCGQKLLEEFKFQVANEAGGISDRKNCSLNPTAIPQPVFFLSQS
jgi:hypothetical protein